MGITYHDCFSGKAIAFGSNKTPQGLTNQVAGILKRLELMIAAILDERKYNGRMKNSALKKTSEFQNVFNAKQSAADNRLICFLVANSLRCSRLGLSISKKRGGAVQRNRWKRMVREMFRLHQHGLPCCADIVIVPQKGTIDLQTPFRNEIVQLVRRIALKHFPTVLITRPAEQCEPLKTDLQQLGYGVFVQPVMKIEPVVFSEADLAPVYDWIIFSSVNGVQHFFNMLKKPVIPGNVQYAAVGSGTGELLQRSIHRPPDLIPSTFNAEGLAEAFRGIGVSNQKILIIRGNRGRKVLKESLLQLGACVSELEVYQSIDVTEPDATIADLMQRGKFRYTTATSPAVAVSLVKMFGHDLHRTNIVSISPLTSATLQDLGFPPQIEAEEASMQGIVRKLRNNVLKQT